MKISFVIPCYNAAKNINGVVAEIDEAMKARPDIAYEIVMVNDASPDDNTAEVIEEIARRHPAAIAVELAKNVGQASALLAGLAQTSGDVIMTSDDDGQTPVGEVFTFLDELERGNYDVVCARYVERDQPSWFRRLGSMMNRKMSDWLIEKPEGVYMSAFFMARRFVVDQMIQYDHSYPYLSALILRVTQNVGNVDMVQRSRASGESGYTFNKLFGLWLNGLTSMSVKPLRVASQFGFITPSWFHLGALYHHSSWSVQNSCRLDLHRCAHPLFSGIILIFMGLLGEYIGRIYMGINHAAIRGAEDDGAASGKARWWRCRCGS